jgi:hypothetical protein
VIESFQLHDEHGRIWPPGFRSRLCDPDDRLCMFNGQTKEHVRKAAKARELACAQGKGWGNGTMESLAPKGYTRAAVPVMKGAKA